MSDELERRWNQLLQRVREIEAQIEEHQHNRGPSTAASREQFADLAADLESLWQSPETDGRLKTRLIRTLISQSPSFWAYATDIGTDAATTAARGLRK